MGSVERSAITWTPRRISLMEHRFALDAVPDLLDKLNALPGRRITEEALRCKANRKKLYRRGPLENKPEWQVKAAASQAEIRREKRMYVSAKPWPGGWFQDNIRVSSRGRVGCLPPTHVDRGSTASMAAI
jgi:hypothetical protein